MKLRGIVFDWAGTTVDYGSRAPLAASQNVFLAAGVTVTAGEVRLSMGVAKKDHIRAILQLPRVTGEWTRVHGTAPGETDVEGLYAEFVPKQPDCLGRFSGAIGGVPETMEELRRRGVRIGSTTGYNRPMLDFLVDRAREQSFAPDCAICPGDVPGGAPRAMDVLAECDTARS
ncbi:MAG: hypothetical protein ABSH56_02625 [Bryobacteraceae bacterium]|jgi:phosphonoacetaldehyde hydrolase